MRFLKYLAVVACLVLDLGGAEASEQAEHIVGHYSDQQLGAIKSITLPRTFLYRNNNVLIDPADWPDELSEVRKTMGDAFCCVSEDGSEGAEGKPPEKCVKIVYGSDVASNFIGLLDEKGAPIDLATVGDHKWLLIEYSASWCAPCLVEKKAIEETFRKSRNASDYIWLTIDMTRLIDAQAAAMKSK